MLADGYAAVLGRGPVGATDSFFDLGGTSLQVMRLVDLIHAELGADVGVTEVFLHPTPRQLAASIDAQRGAGDACRAGPLVRLSSGPGELPLFLVHAVGGTVFSYASLARELAGTFAVSGLEAPGLHRAATPSSLAALADEYTARIRAAQPDGPYRLAGWSMGGVVAFEITRRLEEGGAEVSLLALLDAPFALADDADDARTTPTTPTRSWPRGSWPMPRTAWAGRPQPRPIRPPRPRPSSWTGWPRGWPRTRARPGWPPGCAPGSRSSRPTSGCWPGTSPPGRPSAPRP